jgi:flagellar biosynthesis protein
MAAGDPLKAERVRAVALAYGEAEAAAGVSPRVVATGQGLVAQTIIEQARGHGVPVHESRELVAALMDFDLDQHIPPALYLAVAEVLAWAYRLEQDLGGPPAAAPR